MVVAKNHPTHAANTVCLMMSKPYKTGTFYNAGGRVPYYEISDLKTDAEALYNKMPQGVKSRIVKIKTKAQLISNAGDVEGYVLPPAASEIKGGRCIRLCNRRVESKQTICVLPESDGAQRGRVLDGERAEFRFLLWGVGNLGKQKLANQKVYPNIRLSLLLCNQRQCDVQHKTKYRRKLYFTSLKQRG